VTNQLFAFSAGRKPYADGIKAWEVGAKIGIVKNFRPLLMERVGLL
jgi:hypothetical protein